MSFSKILLLTPLAFLLGLYSDRIASGREELCYKIVYAVREADGSSHLYLMNPNGGNREQVTYGPFHNGYPCFSPDGLHIAFVSDRQGLTDIFAINIDGMGMKNLTNTPDIWEHCPTWSPDGRRICFESHMALYVLDLKTGERKKISPEDPETFDTAPFWSPNGKQIVFESYLHGSNAEIYICNADGTERVRLTDHPSSDQQPTFTPDGRSIVFVSGRLRYYTLFVLNIETKRVQRVHVPENLTTWNPAVSPDGKKITFRAIDRFIKGSPWDIYTVDFPPGRGFEQLTDDDNEEFSPCWSPVPLRVAVTPAGRVAISWGRLKSGSL